VVIQLRQRYVAPRSLQLIIPFAWREILVVFIKQLLSSSDILYNPELQRTLLIMYILHRRFTSLVCVIHGCAWVKEVDRGGIGEVADAIVHCIIDVPASCLEFLFIAETHQRPISHT